MPACILCAGSDVFRSFADTDLLTLIAAHLPVMVSPTALNTPLRPLFI
jgi:hypothetical protein